MLSANLPILMYASGERQTQHRWTICRPRSYSHQQKLKYWNREKGSSTCHGMLLQVDLKQQFANEVDSDRQFSLGLVWLGFCLVTCMLHGRVARLRGIVWFRFWFWFGLIDNMHAAWLNCTWKDFLRFDPDLQFANYPGYSDRQFDLVLVRLRACCMEALHVEGFFASWPGFAVCRRSSSSLQTVWSCRALSNNSSSLDQSSSANF